MAADDTKETQAQFDLQVQINQVLQSRIGILKAQEKALSGQVQMAMDLCKALKCEQLDEIEARLKTARDEMQRAAEDAAALRTSLDEAAAAGADGADNTTGSMKRLRSGIDEVDGAAVGAALGIVRGFGSAFQTVTNLASGLGGILGTFGRLGKAIIGLPFQLLSGLFDIAQSGGGGGGSPIRQELEKIRGEFGSLETSAGKVAAGALTQFRGEMSNLAGTGLRLSKVFGAGREGLAKALAENADLMKALGPAVDNFSDTLNKNAVALSMYRKGLGMTVEQQAKFMKFAQAAGKDPMKEMTKFASQAINMGESMGVSSKLIAKDMAEMQSDFANFGGLGPKVMSQVSVYTRKLGIEIKSLTGLISTFDDFEGAAQGAAKLSQAFGMNVDAMKMMQEQDPAARLSMLQKAFKDTGKSIESMSRQEKKLLAQQSGLDDEAASLAFSQRGLSMSYDQVQKAGAKSEKKQLSQAEAMSKLADSIERVFGSGGSSQFKGFFDSFSKGFQSGIMRSMEFREAMRAIRQSLRAIYRGGIEVGKMFVKLFPGVKDMLKGIKDLFNPDNFRKLMVDVKRIFGDLFKDLQSDPKAGVEKFLQRFKDLFKKFFSASGSGASTLMEGGKTFLKTLGSIFKALMPIVINGIVSAIKAITNILKNPPGVPGALTQLFTDLGDAMKDLLFTLWEKLSPALGELFMTVFEKVGPTLMKGGVAILALSLGKVILSSVTTSLGGALAVTVGKKISSFFGTAFGEADAGGGTSSIGQQVGQAFSEGITGIMQGLKAGLKAIADIPVKDILMAGAKLALLTIVLMPSLLLFAFAVKLVADMFTIELALTAVAAMAAIATAALAVSVLVNALQLVSPGMIGTAMLGALAAAVFIIGGVIVMAAALRLISSAFVGIDWMGVGIGMMGMAVAMVSIIAMVFAASVLNPALVGTALLGLLAGTAFLAGMWLFLIPLRAAMSVLSDLKLDPLPWINMAVVMGSLAFTALAAASFLAVGTAGVVGLIPAALFVYTLSEMFLPVFQDALVPLSTIDMAAAGKAFLSLAAVFVGLAIIAGAAALAGYVAVYATAALVPLALFTYALAMPDIGILSAIRRVETAAAGIDLTKLETSFKALVPAFIAIGLIAAAAAIAGSASVYGLVGLIPLAAFVWAASKIAVPALNVFVSGLGNYDRAIPKIEGLGMLFVALGGMALLAIALGSFANPLMGWIIVSGLALIRVFGAAIETSLKPAIDSLNALNLDPEALKPKIEALGGVFEILGSLADIVSSIGSMDVGVFSDTTPQQNLAAASTFLESLTTNISGIVDKIVNTPLSEEKLRSAAAIGDIFKSIGELVRGIQPDPKTLEALKSQGMFGSDAASPESIAKLTQHTSTMLDAVKDKIGPIFTKIQEVANGIPDPTALEPKIKLVGESFNILSSFTKVISSMVKDIAGTEGTATEKVATFTETVSGIVTALFTGNTSYMKMAFDGITAMTAGITNPAEFEPKIKALAGTFDILSKFTSVIGDVAKMIPPESETRGAESNAFASRLADLVGPNGLIMKITDALTGGEGGGAIGSAYNKLKSLIDEIPNVDGGKLKQFEQKGKALAGLFDVMSKFSSAVKDVASLGTVKDGAIDPSSIRNIINNVGSVLVGAGSDVGAIQNIAEKLAKMTQDDDIKKLARNPGGIKAVSSLFKAMGDFANGISALRSLGGEGGDMTAVSNALSKIATAFSDTAETGLVKSVSSIASRMNDLQGSLARNPLNVRNVTRLTEFANGLSTAITALETIAGPSTGIQARVVQLGAAFDELHTQFSRLGNDGSTALAIGVGRELTGDGRVTIDHEIANINLHVNIQLSAEDIGRGVITWSKRTESSSTNADPRFQLRTSG